jgi:hypothetical protein
MIRVLVLIALGSLAAVPQAFAACRWFGTQLECEFGASQAVIGTQAAQEPRYARLFGPNRSTALIHRSTNARHPGSRCSSSRRTSAPILRSVERSRTRPTATDPSRTEESQ